MNHIRGALACVIVALAAGCASSPSGHAGRDSTPIAQVALDPRVRDIVVKRAQWGYGERCADVTGQVIALLRGRRGFAAKAEDLLKDPAPYRSKALAILFEYHGSEHLFVAPGGAHVDYNMLIETAQKH